MKTVDIGGMPQSLADFAHGLGSEPVVVTDGGTPVAVVVPVEEADAETLSPSNNPKFLEIIQESRDSYAREGGISSEEVRRQLGID